MVHVTRRQFLRTAGASTLAINMGSLLVGCSTAAPIVSAAAFDPALHVDPELRAVALRLQKQVGQFSLSMETLEKARKAQYARPALAEPSWTEKSIPGFNGSPEVRVFIVNATGHGQPRPAILHTHGGGFVTGSAKSSLNMIQELALALNCVVISVDYRLAPETRFPGALEDNYAALKWLYAHADEVGVDKSRIAVLGESAGGGHATMLAIAARDRGEVPLVFQALIYPMLDDRTGSTRTVPPHIGTLIWTAQSNRFGWTSLLGVPAGSSRVPAGAVPARVEDLRGLPATFIGVGSIDLFVQEDIAYAARLVDAGVSTELHVVPGAFHGFEMVAPKATVSKQFKAALNNALMRAFERT